MNDLVNGLAEALRLVLGGDAETWRIVLLSLQVAGTAVLLGSLIGIPLGALLGLRRFFGWRLAVALIYTGMALPPVVVGLIVYLLLSNSGPLGVLQWLFTPRAMVAAQTLICLPLIAGLTMSAIRSIDPGVALQARSLGANELQLARALLYEARQGLVVAVVVGFGRCISEVGAVMLVGGNIQGSTRVLTTAIVLNTRTGDFDLALALAAVLLGVAFLVNGVVLYMQGHVIN